MGVLYADTDAKFRNEILSNTRHMIERLRGAVAYMTRELENAKFLLEGNKSSGLASPKSKLQLVDEISVLLKAHQKFLQWYLKFLSGEMIPTASYQRHITSLKAITSILRSGILESEPSLPLPKAMANATNWPFKIIFFTPGNMRLILDLLMNPFEDVRISAGVVLKLASRDAFEAGRTTDTMMASDRSDSQHGHPSEEVTNELSLRSDQSLTSTATASPQLLLDFINRAQAIAKRTGRADYGDGVARSFEILYCLRTSTDARLTLIEDLVEQLELKVEIAETDLTRAVLEAPIHGNFAALKYVLDDPIGVTINVAFQFCLGCNRLFSKSRNLDDAAFG